MSQQLVTTARYRDRPRAGLHSSSPTMIVLAPFYTVLPVASEGRGHEKV